MPVGFKSHLIFLWALGLCSLILLLRFAHTGTMDSLSSSFTIEVNGRPIANVGDGAEDPIQAKTGSEAAVFTLKDGRLQCGDWLLGRSVTEDRSFLPKQVLWFKSNKDSDRRVRPVTASENGGSYQLRFANARLIAEDGNIFADLQEGDEQSSVTLKV
ncbi:hypothetical protein K505DRAFT_327055 [Melanomma pulvis-pyrius CBS 109.77]|uniref:Uncharacterized protein n=1 Tax=Melanomma pulvis-pyrius CBS 109.77 TaxID=1314802 RepID=A0A6A6X472_9PLEO|nr:hypothetical protein K505DRAFT_327055 [Melanomma pulvis-pyrius CBS 109.77]